MPHNRIKRPTPYPTIPQNAPATSPGNQIIPTTWNGWFFEYDYFCDIEGNRYRPEQIKACFFLWQMKAARKIAYDWPAQIQ